MFCIQLKIQFISVCVRLLLSYLIGPHFEHDTFKGAAGQENETEMGKKSEIAKGI